MKWISVKDQLPSLDICVLGIAVETTGYGVEAHVFIVEFGDDNSWSHCDSDGYIFGEGIVTHWMPLPEPPKE